MTIPSFETRGRSLIIFLNNQLLLKKVYTIHYVSHPIVKAGNASEQTGFQELHNLSWLQQHTLAGWREILSALVLRTYKQLSLKAVLLFIVQHQILAAMLRAYKTIDDE